MRAHFVELELAAARAHVSDPARAFAHLERAHILSQPHTRLHMRTHRAMLAWAWRQRDAREIFGQCTRLVAALIFSRLWIPLGNTGGARVSAIEPMPIAEDLRRILDQIAVSERR